MDPRDVRSFMARDWSRIAEAKAHYWAERKRQLGPSEGVRISDELRRQALALKPGWPDLAERAADLEAHAQLSQRMRDAGATFGR